jgi:hypothetical protein
VKTTNISVLGLFAGDGLEHILATDDPDGPIIDFESVDDRMNVALSGVVSAVSSFSFISRANVSIFPASMAAAVPHWARAWAGAALARSRCDLSAAVRSRRMSSSSTIPSSFRVETPLFWEKLPSVGNLL